MNRPQQPIHPAQYPLSLPMARVRVLFEARDPLQLPGFGGSTLRGCLGQGLRALSCIMPPNHACPECHRRTACSYGQLFEPAVPPALRERYSKVPPPWVLEPEWATPQQLQPGQRFACRINLFGPAIRRLPELLQGLDQGVRQGIGKGRGRARLAEVFQQQGRTGCPFRERGRNWWRRHSRSTGPHRWPAPWISV